MTVHNQGSMRLYVPQGCVKCGDDSKFIACEDDRRLDSPNGVTVTAWVKLNSYGFAGAGSDGTIMSKNSLAGWQFWMDDDAKLRLDDGFGVSINTESNANVLPLNNWLHVAVTYDRNNVIFYVNGNDVGTEQDQSALSVGGQVYIGNTTSAELDGYIHDVRLYSGIALTANEIKLLYNGMDVSRNLVGHWLCDEKTGDYAVDEIYGITGALLNGASWEDRDVRCWGTRWDEGNDRILLTTFINACDRNYLANNVVPGAVRELYNILGTKKFIDTTFSSSNTIIVEPIGDYGISSVRSRKIIAVKNFTTKFIDKDTYSLKIDGIVL